MKKFSLIILVFILSACDMGREVSAGFDSAFEPGAYGVTTLSIDQAGESVFLEGSVQLDSGSVVVQLLYPSGAIAWNSTLIGSGESLVNEEFSSNAGDYVLMYESSDGSGYINLSLHN